MIVVDASAVVDALLDGGVRGEWARSELASAAALAAPHLLDVEVTSAARALARRKVVPLGRAHAAIDDFGRLRVRRYPTTPLLEEIWALSGRGSVTAYDAAYVALASVLDCALLTTDRKLAVSRLPVAVRTY